MKLVLMLLLVLAASSAQAAPKASDIAAYRALVAQDLRLASVGYRIASANAPFCKRTERNPGWVIHDVAQYSDPETAIAAFAFSAPVSVAAVVSSGPAAHAGLIAGDGFRTIGGESLDWGDKTEGQPTYQRVQTVKEVAKRQLASSGKLLLILIRGNQSMATTIEPVHVCASDFQVDTKTKLDAGADGSIVRVTSALMAYVADDDELAAVVAHELAHNVLSHPERWRGLKRGRTQVILATEIEADRLSMWLMANAGYDPGAALRFWLRYGRRSPFGMTDGRHLWWKKRVALMRAEIDLMARTEKKDGLLPPPLLVE